MEHRSAQPKLTNMQYADVVTVPCFYSAVQLLGARRDLSLRYITSASHVHCEQCVGTITHRIGSSANTTCRNHVSNLTVQVVNGPTYTLALNGSGYKPKLNLSFLNYDFGPCHVFQQGMVPATVKLAIVNEDKQPVSFDTVFDNTDNWQVGGHDDKCKRVLKGSIMTMP